METYAVNVGYELQNGAVRVANCGCCKSYVMNNAKCYLLLAI